MIKNYTNRLDKLRDRRFDAQKKIALFSKSYEKPEHGLALKYTYESMGEIDPNYTQNTITAAEIVKSYLRNGLNIFVDFRFQGSIMTNTHIRLHSDIDLLVFHRLFYGLEAPQVPIIPYHGNPENDLRHLRDECYRILSANYDKIDNSKAKALEVFQATPSRKIDIVACNWFNSNEYVNFGNNEILRGVNIYDAEKHVRTTDYPFAHIHSVKAKDSRVNNGLRKLVRLLKTLKADAEIEINLSSFEISSIVHAIEDSLLNKDSNYELNLLSEASTQLAKLIVNTAYRQQLMSPNDKEPVFGQDSSKVQELEKLKKELDELILDLREELKVGATGFIDAINY